MNKSICKCTTAPHTRDAQCTRFSLTGKSSENKRWVHDASFVFTCLLTHTCEWKHVISKLEYSLPIFSVGNFLRKKSIFADVPWMTCAILALFGITEDTQTVESFYIEF